MNKKEKRIERKVVELKTLQLDPNNPRLIRDERYKKLLNSIKEDPDFLSIREIVVDSDLLIRGGSQRYRACIELGMQTAPVCILHNFTEKDLQRFTIKDNVAAGEWDYELLANNFEATDLQDWGVPLWDVPEFSEVETLQANENGTDHDRQLRVLFDTVGQLNAVKEALKNSDAKAHTILLNYLGIDQ